MGVYLPNVDMPKGDKVVTIQICPDGSIWQQYRGTVPNAKAVPVPPHGRLIDADAFAAEMRERQKAAGKWLREAKDRETAVRADAVLSFLCEVKLTLDAVPTIIPAEEEVNK